MGIETPCRAQCYAASVRNARWRMDDRHRRGAGRRAGRIRKVLHAALDYLDQKRELASLGANRRLEPDCKSH